MSSRWRTVGSVEWLERDVDPLPPPDSGAATLPRTAVAPAEVSVLFAAATAAETATQIGVGAAALTALAAELARPRETADHRILELDVGTFNGVHSRSVRLVGEPAAIRVGLQTLESLLLDPRSLTLPESGARPFLWAGWWREFTCWFGVGGATLSADQPDPWAGDLADLHEQLRRWHPSRGGRIVAWTTDADLTGAAFAGGVPVPPDPRAPWREPSPLTTANAVHGSYANNLATVRVPGTIAHELALQILARTAHRSLVQLGRLVDALDTIAEPIGVDTLLGIRGMDASDRVDYVQVRRVLLDALESLTEIGDQAILEHVELAREHGLFAAEPDHCARRALITGRCQTPDELRAELGMLPVEQVRAALATVRDQTLLSVWNSEPDPPGRVRWQPPALDEPSKPYVRRSSTTFVPARVGSEKQVYRADGRTLELAVRPRMSRGWSGARSASAIDLRQLVVREDIGPEYSRLVDRDGRLLTITWPSLLRAAPLRAAIDAATPPGALLHRPTDPVATGELRSTMRKARLGQALFVVLMIVFAVLIYFHPVT